VWWDWTYQVGTIKYGRERDGMGSPDCGKNRFGTRGANGRERKRRYTRPMNVPGDAVMDTQELERTLRELLAPDRLPDYIESARYELGTDHLGEPAVRIFLGISSQTDILLSKDKARRKLYSDFTDDLSSRILKLESGYFPFIRLVDAA
jgi:hypothetical protein